METIYRFEFPDMLIEARAVRDADYAVFKACASEAYELSLQGQRSSPAGAQGQFVLWCLLCSGGGMEGAGGDPSLVEAQEHLMEAHGLSREDLAAAIRLRRDGDDGQYIWALPPERAGQLNLPRLSYLCARRGGMAVASEE